MIAWYQLAPDGQTFAVIGTGSAPATIDGVVSGVTPAELTRMMLDGQGGLVPRPVSPGVSSAGTQHTVAGCPLGTEIAIFDLSGNEELHRLTVAAEGTSEVIDLPDPGRYQIEVQAPMPALPTYTEVTTP
ncbi:hypothetical protein [Roseobacter sp. S98]|uniref:hypothetical protein n=1 Tax=Roseobacter algicola (ex Choi et al. 2025) (nom. illeg.) TaxID=3092138 RepID=UPI0035C6A1DF